MPRSTRPLRERTHDWQQIQQYILWPEQKVYELLHPVVIFNESAAERARETGEALRTLQRKANLFESHGMASLFSKEPTPPFDDARELPPDMRQLIVDLKTEHPAFRPHEIATVCYVRFGRHPSHQTVQRVLASGPQPLITARHFPPHSEIASGYERRRILARLHEEGWSVSTIGVYRVMAALEQIGIKLSQRTCTRLLQLNWNLYGLEKPKRSPHSKKEMPFKASFRHQYWSVDIRYIEKHHIPDHGSSVYIISILENYSRAVLAGKVSPTQKQWDYLEVLFAPFSIAEIPKAIVSDGGGIFYSHQAMYVYQALGIKKERIDPKQAWQNYVETMLYVIWNLQNSQITCIMWTTSAFLLKSFQRMAGVFHIINIVRRMADFHFHQATSWEEIQRLHRKWVQDYNSQRHWAHESRDDGCHSPAGVISWHKGTMVPQETLNRMLFATRYTRFLDRHGYIQFQDWQLYGERGLARRQIVVWVYEGTLKLEYQAVTLSKYRVELLENRKHIKGVSTPRVAETVFRSPQLTLIDLGPNEWLLYWRATSYAIRRRKQFGTQVVQLPLLEMPFQEKAAWAEAVSLFLRLVVSPGPKDEDS